jgi:outer membrane protein
MKKILTSALLLTSFASADFIGAEVGAAGWYPSLSGNIKYKGDSIEYENDMGFDADVSTYFWATIEHPVPLIPNLKLKHTKLALDSTKTLSTNLQFADKTYALSTDTTTSLNMKQTDFIIYYEILDNWVNLDLGINVKLIDGDISMSNTTNTESKSFYAPIPMGYAKAQFDLPFTGAFVSAECSTISYDNNSIYDAEASVGYESGLGFGAKVGYRVESINIDDIKDIDTDTKLSGAFFSLYYHF